MIADTLSNYKQYTGVHQDLEQGFRAIEECLSKPLPEGNQRVQVNGFTVVVQYYTTKDPSEKKLEGHKKCLDIQYMVSGKETIYWENTDGLQPCTEYNEQRDHLNYADGGNDSPIRLQGGQFAIFSPHDAHKTGCVWNEAQDVVKLIVKVQL
jgi:biofilm protein TabA